MTNVDLMNRAGKLGLPLVGVFSKDKIPRVPRDGFYIINLQDDKDGNGIHLPGTHWVSFYIERSHAVYFDPFGSAPPIQVQNFLKPFIPYEYNTKEIQNINSSVCGSYAIGFMKYMSSHRSKDPNIDYRFNKFLAMFSNNPVMNRGVLLNFLRES